MLQAYCDESGIGQPPVVVLAGWVASGQKWFEFSSEWAGILSMRPSVPYFKMDEAMSLTGQFYGFSEQSRNEKVMYLKRVIDRYAETGIACCLPISDFNKIIKADDAAPRSIKEPYFFALYGLVNQITRQQKKLGIYEVLEWTFDEEVRLKATVGAHWDAFKRNATFNRNLLGRPPSFRDDKFVLPLQAADMLSWSVRKRWMERAQGEKPSVFPWQLWEKPATQGPNLFVFEWDKQELLYNVARAKAVTPVSVNVTFSPMKGLES